MIKLFLNGLAASAGGGLTYVRNVLPNLSARDDVQVTAALPPDLKREFAALPNVTLLEINFPGGVIGRFLQEQIKLPGLIRQSGAEVLISAGNFALRNSPVPQILLSRNSLYTSADFFQDLRRRREYGLWLDTWIKSRMARKSIRWANRTVAPTKAFADQLRHSTGRAVATIPHGFDRAAFFQDQTPLDPDVQEKLRPGNNEVRLLFVSHYNYYRNFETLFRALPLLRDRMNGRRVKLFLTCRLRSEENPGTYRANIASTLIPKLGIADNVVELGTVPYALLHLVYRSCDMYVTPAYAESFAHPLVEAMASGLPIVAADTPVHREICQDAAVYFQRFSAQELSDKILQIATSDPVARELSLRGQKRSEDFSWQRHVDDLLELARNLLVTINATQDSALTPTRD